MHNAEPRSLPAIALHWLVAVGIIGLMVLGFYMSLAEVWPLYPWHKSFGLIVFMLAAIRIGWRIRTGWPAGSSTNKLAHAVHHLLIVATLAMPLTGMLFSGAGGHGIDLFGLVIVPENPDPSQAGEVLAYSAGAAALGAKLHAGIAYLLAGILLLHIAAALKHHFIDRDNTLRRMLGRRC